MTEELVSPSDPALPSLTILMDQVALEGDTLASHADSLDAKAGVVLGFAGVLIGLGATAQASVTEKLVFQIGLGVAVLAALAAASAFLRLNYPVLEVYTLRQKYLTTPEAQTRLTVLDTRIEINRQYGVILRGKARLVRAAVFCLAIAAGLVVIGTFVATAGRHHS